MTKPAGSVCARRHPVCSGRQPTSIVSVKVGRTSRGHAEEGQRHSSVRFILLPSAVSGIGFCSVDFRRKSRFPFSGAEKHRFFSKAEKSLFGAENIQRRLFVQGQS